MKSKNAVKSKLMAMSWAEYIEKVQWDSHLNGRIKVIKICTDIFRENGENSFSNLHDNERRFIAGIYHELPVDAEIDNGYFGRMIANGVFKREIIANNSFVSEALDEIPLSGFITRNHYDRFLEKFKKGLPGNRVGGVSRLLAMKRPDTFVCLNSVNREALLEELYIDYKTVNYDKYFNDIIARIYECTWWQNPNPKNEIEKMVSNARVAFLDSYLNLY